MFDLTCNSLSSAIVSAERELLPSSTFDFRLVDFSTSWSLLVLQLLFRFDCFEARTHFTASTMSTSATPPSLSRLASVSCSIVLLFLLLTSDSRAQISTPNCTDDTDWSWVSKSSPPYIFPHLSKFRIDIVRDRILKL